MSPQRLPQAGVALQPSLVQTSPLQDAPTQDVPDDSIFNHPTSGQEEKKPIETADMQSPAQAEVLEVDS